MIEINLCIKLTGPWQRAGSLTTDRRASQGVCTSYPQCSRRQHARTNMWRTSQITRCGPLSRSFARLYTLDSPPSAVARGADDTSCRLQLAALLVSVLRSFLMLSIVNYRLGAPNEGAASLVLPHHMPRTRCTPALTTSLGRLARNHLSTRCWLGAGSVREPEQRCWLL